MKKFLFTVLAAATAFAAMAQTDIWCWQGGAATKKAATDSVTLAKPASLGDILVWKDGVSAKLAATDSITFTSGVTDFYHDGSEAGYNYVDLGLTSGTKWATMNVGASKAQEYGNYYAWGETTTKETYDWNTYLDGIMSSSSYCGTYMDALKGVTDIAGTQYDAAKANWGGKWRMPTHDQQFELMRQCYWVWTESYNNSKVKGYIVYKAKTSSDKGKYVQGKGETPSSSYSLSDAHIFLPAAGYGFGGGIYHAGSEGNYWSSSLSDYPYAAWGVDLLSDDVRFIYAYGFRYFGFSVRAVISGE